MKPAQFYLQHCHSFDAPQEQRLPISQPDFDHLDVFFNSVTHLETTKLQLEKIFMCVFQYQCLEATGYFKDIQTEALTYFQDVEPSLIHQLYTLYAYDFELFQYSLEGFL